VHTTVVVIGAGHSGLAMSRRLTERSIDHVVLERGSVANSWSTQRWESLRLLTPNWLTRLPGVSYAGDHPDGFLSAGQVAAFLRDYATAVDAPVRTNTLVTRVAARDDGGYLTETDQGNFTSDAIVLASGANNLPNIPVVAAGVPDGVDSLSPLDYRSPEQVLPGGILVVGASATGAQLAHELAAAGRRVVLSVSEHVRMPRSYRGRDIFWWMDGTGVLDERYDQVDDIIRARHVPSPQLVGSPERSVDLNALRDSGVEVVGRLGAIRDGVALFSGGLANVFHLADQKQERLLDRFDLWAEANAIAGLGPIERPEPTREPDAVVTQLDLRAAGIGTVLWATGFKPDYSWLDLPVLDYKGRIQHDGGVLTKSPGAYLLGASLLRRRRSTYIDGAGQDTAELAEHLTEHLAGARVAGSDPSSMSRLTPRL
jgi:putative flavoprotein involved in K+ transport